MDFPTSTPAHLFAIRGKRKDEVVDFRKVIYLRLCDTDTYFRNIIFSNISEILFMCITDYFKLLSYSCAIKTLNLKFLTESEVKKTFV